MKVVALISGGKDSCYNMMQCCAEQHTIVALANLKPQDKDELDSYMYQTVGHHAIDMYAEAMELPLYIHIIKGSSINIDKDYTQTEGDEVEDLYQLLKKIKQLHAVEGVSVGAILSDYQRIRVEHVCQRLNLVVLAYLWRRDQSELLNEMIKCGLRAIIIKVAALGLDPDKHLGKTLAEIYPHMIKMHEQYGLNVCGEGGEYETFTLDCPLFKKEIVIEETEQVIHSADAFAPVAYLNFKSMHLREKKKPNKDIQLSLLDLPMINSRHLYEDLFGKDSESLSGETVPSAYSHELCNVEEIVAHDMMDQKVTGDYLCITGITGKHEDNMAPSVIAQLAMDNMKDVISSHGLSFGNVVAVHMYLKHMKFYQEMNAKYREYFDNNPPIRICVETILPENVAVLMDCLVLSSQEVNTMHVQGISHWAPHNIGPYAQCKKVDKLLFVAGQIALCPATMSIIDGGIVPQTRLSLRHVDRILSAMDSSCTIGNAVVSICYVTSVDVIPSVRQERQAYLSGLRDQDGLHTPDIVEYVHISALPRGALVEWQVYAISSTASWTSWHTTLNKDSYEASVDVRHSGEHELACVIHIKERTSLAHLEAISPKREHSVIQLLGSSIRKMLENPNGGSNRRTFRIFYKMHVLEMGSLYTTWNDLASSCEDLRRLSMAFVPVLNFESPEVVLSAIH